MRGWTRSGRLRENKGEIRSWEKTEGKQGGKTQRENTEMILRSGLGVWVERVGVVSGRWEWVEAMGGGSARVDVHGGRRMGNTEGVRENAEVILVVNRSRLCLVTIG
jgi:hypothetical protein